MLQSDFVPSFEEEWGFVKILSTNVLSETILSLHCTIDLIPTRPLQSVPNLRAVQPNKILQNALTRAMRTPSFLTKLSSTTGPIRSDIANSLPSDLPNDKASTMTQDGMQSGQFSTVSPVQTYLQGDSLNSLQQVLDVAQRADR